LKWSSFDHWLTGNWKYELSSKEALRETQLVLPGKSDNIQKEFSVYPFFFFYYIADSLLSYSADCNTVDTPTVIGK